MLTSPPLRKAKVNLADYPYRRDIDNRMVMAQLSVFEVHILQEIVHHSVHISIEQLAKEVHLAVDQLIPILDKLSATKLFKRQGMKLVVDKDMRKYFEFQLEKFDEDFEPNLDFLQNVLNRVPIHVLPLWYAIPRTSDNIFASIIEKYFLTPKVYRQYLSELEFDHPVFNSIIQDLYQAPDFKISATHLMTKYGLTRETFEEYLLLLEYQFVCCLSYTRVEEEWQEVVTLFSEWLEYLQFEVQTKPLPIRDSVESTYHSKFNFVHDLITLLQACQNKKTTPEKVKNIHASTALQLHSVVNKLIQVEFVKQAANGQLMATEKGKEWLTKPFPEQIAHLASDPLNLLSNAADFSTLIHVRNLHLIEKSLRRLLPNEWVDLNQFLEGFSAPIGDRGPIILKNKGKKWRYELPTYTTHEKQFIQTVILERFAELGLVETGFYQDKPCFCLTSFGNHFIHYH